MITPVDKVAAFIARHEMFRPGDRVGVAVSGGPDSVFLLHVLRELAPSWNLHLHIVHIEHGIRGEASLADAEFVRKLGEEFGFPFHEHHADVPSLNGNLEQAARQVRSDFYRELLSSGCLDRIATGHTRSDQAETVLYRAIRGSGLAGLAGILPVTDDGLVRPLLDVTSSEIREWLAQRSIAWRDDETNQDPSYARNRLRHEVLPRLAETFNPRLEDALANLATLAQDEEGYWESELDRLLPAPAAQDPLILPIATLTSAPSAVARRLVRRLIQTVKGDLRQVEFAHIERILEMTRSSEGHDRVQIPGLDVIRSFEWVRFSKISYTAQLLARDFSLPLPAPGFAELPGGSARIILQVLEKTEAEQPCATLGNELDFERLHLPEGAVPSLELRNWRPGDKYRRVGRNQEEKIKLLFQEGRVPLWERRLWPIITYNGFILWARRFGAAADFAALPGARVVLRIDESG